MPTRAEGERGNSWEVAGCGGFDFARMIQIWRLWVCEVLYSPQLFSSVPARTSQSWVMIEGVMHGVFFCFVVCLFFVLFFASCLRQNVWSTQIRSIRCFVALLTSMASLSFRRFFTFEGPFRSLSVFLSVCVPVCMSVSLSLLCLSICLCLSLIPLFLYVSFSLSLSVFVSVSLYLRLCPSVCLSLVLIVSLAVLLNRPLLYPNCFFFTSSIMMIFIVMVMVISTIVCSHRCYQHPNYLLLTESPYMFDY